MEVVSVRLCQMKIAFRLSLECAHRSFESYERLDRRYSMYSVRSHPLNDYLHPKYSLPPIKMNIMAQQVT